MTLRTCVDSMAARSPGLPARPRARQTKVLRPRSVRGVKPYASEEVYDLLAGAMGPVGPTPAPRRRLRAHLDDTVATHVRPQRGQGLRCARRPLPELARCRRGACRRTRRDDPQRRARPAEGAAHPAGVGRGGGADGRVRHLVPRRDAAGRGQGVAPESAGSRAEDGWGCPLVCVGNARHGGRHPHPSRSREACAHRAEGHGRRGPRRAREALNRSRARVAISRVPHYARAPGVQGSAAAVRGVRTSRAVSGEGSDRGARRYAPADGRARLQAALSSDTRVVEQSDVSTPTAVPSEPLRSAVADLLAALCAEHGLSPLPQLEWSSRMRRALGRAYVDRNMIRLSAWLDEQQAHDTLRHEAGPHRCGPPLAVTSAWAELAGLGNPSRRRGARDDEVQSRACAASFAAPPRVGARMLSLRRAVRSCARVARPLPYRLRATEREAGPRRARRPRRRGGMAWRGPRLSREPRSRVS